MANKNDIMTGNEDDMAHLAAVSWQWSFVFDKTSGSLRVATNLPVLFCFFLLVFLHPFLGDS